MPTTKHHVLAEIKRLAGANGGPPGKRLFERETGIREADWFPALWLRWGDALQEAGYDRNKMVEMVNDDILLEQYALLAQRLGRLPIKGELIREANANPSFPGEKSYRRFGGKAGLVRAVASFCKTRESFEDVIGMCGTHLPVNDTRDEEDQKPVGIGFVYLMQHGAKREYKIGRTNNAIRREGELGIELPHGAQPVHALSTCGFEISPKNPRAMEMLRGFAEIAWEPHSLHARTLLSQRPKEIAERLLSIDG